jgi:hypothetical protein
MNVDEIRKITKSRPFKTFEIHLDNGEIYPISHPENIIVTNQLILTADEQGQAALITPESISTIVITDRHE